MSRVVPAPHTYPLWCIEDGVYNGSRARVQCFTLDTKRFVVRVVPGGQEKEVENQLLLQKALRNKNPAHPSMENIAHLEFYMKGGDFKGIRERFEFGVQYNDATVWRHYGPNLIEHVNYLVGLRDKIAVGRVLDQAHQMVKQVWGAVKFLHECGWGHNDLGPANVCWDGLHYVIIDFGNTARRIESSDRFPKQTVTNPRVFLPGFSPNEVSPVHTDMYAFSMMMLSNVVRILDPETNEGNHFPYVRHSEKEGSNAGCGSRAALFFLRNHKLLLSLDERFGRLLWASHDSFENFPRNMEELRKIAGDDFQQMREKTLDYLLIECRRWPCNASTCPLCQKLHEEFGPRPTIAEAPGLNLLAETASLQLPLPQSGQSSGEGVQLQHLDEVCSDVLAQSRQPSGEGVQLSHSDKVCSDVLAQSRQPSGEGLQLPHLDKFPSNTFDDLFEAGNMGGPCAWTDLLGDRSRSGSPGGPCKGGSPDFWGANYGGVQEEVGEVQGVQQPFLYQPSQWQGVQQPCHQSKQGPPEKRPREDQSTQEPPPRPPRGRPPGARNRKPTKKMLAELRNVPGSYASMLVHPGTYAQAATSGELSPRAKQVLYNAGLRRHESAFLQQQVDSLEKMLALRDTHLTRLGLTIGEEISFSKALHVISSSVSGETHP